MQADVYDATCKCTRAVELDEYVLVTRSVGSSGSALAWDKMSKYVLTQLFVL